MGYKEGREKQNEVSHTWGMIWGEIRGSSNELLNFA